MRRRLDILLVERGLTDTRSQAQARIRAGEVSVDGQVIDKPGTSVDVGAKLDLRLAPPFVSRGGNKLAAALQAFGVDPTGWTCLDVGASTGGFTDALLQRGARRVYAVDVGRSQLAWSLRTDDRVICMERTDIRSVRQLPEPCRLATVDVAFISLRLVLPAVKVLLTDNGLCIALIKPQFEAGRELVPRGGIVRDPGVHRSVLVSVLEWARANGWLVLDAVAAPRTRPTRNREFLALLAAESASVEEARAISTGCAVQRALRSSPSG